MAGDGLLTLLTSISNEQGGNTSLLYASVHDFRVAGSASWYHRPPPHSRADSVVDPAPREAAPDASHRLMLFAVP